MSLKLSKKIKHGTIVTKRGDKYIVCGKKATPVGVFQGQREMWMITDYSSMDQFQIPRGVQVKGHCEVTTYLQPRLAP